MFWTYQSYCLVYTHVDVLMLVSDFIVSFAELKSQHLRSYDSEDAANPGNNLYVTGLSARVTESDLEKYFNREGKVCFFMYFITSNTSDSVRLG